MLRSNRLRKGLAFLLAVALLSVVGAGSALAAPQDEQLAELEQRVDGLESLVKDLSISVMVANKKVEAATVEVGPRLLAVENMVKDLSFDVKKTVSSLSGMQAEVDALSAQVEEFQPLVISLQATVVDFGDKLMYISNDIDKLTVGLANTQSDVEALDASVEHLGGQIATLSDEFAQLYSTTSAVKAQVEANTADIGTIRTELGSAVLGLSVKVSANTETIYENREGIQELHDYLQTATKDLQDALEKAFAHEDSQEQRISKLERAVNELSILGPTLASLRNTVAGLAARADRTDARLGRLEDVAEQFAETAETFSQVAGMTQQLAARLNDAESMIAELKEKGGQGVGNIQVAINDLQQQIDQIKAVLGTAGGVAVGELEALSRNVSMLLIELERTKQEVSELRDRESVTEIDKELIVQEIRAELGDLEEVRAIAEEALKKAEAANGLALLALLASVAAIALTLLL